MTLPYIQNTTEKLKRILQRYNFMVAVKPAQKLGQVLTRVKDKARFPLSYFATAGETFR